MKKLFSIIMCVLMVMCFMPTLAFATDGATTQDSGHVASVTTAAGATTYYDTLVAAIGELTDGATLKLLVDTMVTLNDTSNGGTDGTGADSSLWSEVPNVTFDLNNKTLRTISNYGGSFNILNVFATGWTIKDGTIIVTKKDGSADSYAIGAEYDGGTLTVDNVALSGGIAVYGTMTVTMKDTSMGKTQVAATNYYCAYAEGAKIIIDGGEYTSNGSKPIFYAASSSSIEVKSGEFTGSIFGGKGTISITGGTFSSDPTAYLAEGKTVVASGDSKYPYEVESKTEHVEVAKTAEAKVESDVKIDKSKTPAQQEAITNEVELVSDAIKETSITGLEVAAATEATKDAKAQDIESAKNALKVALPDAGIDDQTPVNVFVQPYLNIKIADADFDIAGDTEVVATVKELTLDIVPMVKTIATTATEANDIVTESDNGKTKNAVEIEEAKEVKVTTPVTITIPLPAGFVTSTDTPLYIKHTKDNRASYVYTATVTSKEVNEKTSFYATFTNPNGFSEFLMTKDNISVAKIGEVGYTTLQDAVNAVKDGETITLTQDAGSATVNRTVSFNVEKGDFTYEIKIGGNSKNSGTDDSYEVVYTAPRHSSSSKSSTVDKTEDPTKDTGAVDEKDSKTTATELANALSFKARSSKTAKGNIKVNLTVTDDEIQAIEKLGYTVKYKFYRSTEKSSGYTAMKEKDAKTYTNTTGKSGTRYYYKARVMVYDSDGTLVTYTALKQCKYASRIK